MVHTLKAAALRTHAADRVHGTSCPAAFLIFIAQNPAHLLYIYIDICIYLFYIL